MEKETRKEEEGQERVEGGAESGGGVEESSESASWSQWGGWLQQTVINAKNKSASAFDVVRKDLNEFSCTMQTDTKTIADNVKSQINQENASTASQKVRQGMSHFLGEITKLLTVDAEDKEDTPTSPVLHEQGIFDRAQARLHAIQLDPGTYCNEPSGPQAEYDKWLESFSLDAQKGAISELLVAHVQVRALYTQLVPGQVSHASFWRHYYYKVHQLEQDEVRKAELMRRAEQIQQEEEAEAWEEDDWGDIGGPSSPPKSSNRTTTDLPPHPATSTLPDDVPHPTTATPPPSPALPHSDTHTPDLPDTEPSDSSVAQEGVESEEVQSRVRGDLVVVGGGSSGSDRSSTDSATNNKESLDEDWEKDFDIEVTEEDIRAAQEAASRLTPSTDTVVSSLHNNSEHRQHGG